MKIHSCSSLQFIHHKGLFLVILLASFLAVMGCKEEDNDRPRPAPPSYIYEPNPDAPPNTGLLHVYAFASPNFRPLSRADVSLFLTYEDYEKDLYFDRGLTDRYGLVDFRYLNFGNYYVLATFVDQGIEYQIVEPVQVQDGQTLTRNLIMF